jgi:hypothetical protein
MARQRKRPPHVDERKKVIAVSASAKANGAIREDIKALTEDITAYFTGRKQVSAAIADFDGRLDQLQKSLDDFKAESSRDYDDRLDQIQKSLDVLKKAENSEEVESSKETESSKGGFWHRLLRIPDEDTERARERTRARIAYALIGTLVVAIASTFLYVVTLSAGQLSPQEIINVTHGLGTTLLAPLVGLIGAVIGFYYGGQTAVQGAQQATAASQKHAETTQETSKVATEAATQATQAAQETSKVATEAAKEATQAATQATQAATQATQTATQATEVAKEVAQANHQ